MGIHLKIKQPDDSHKYNIELFALGFKVKIPESWIQFSLIIILSLIIIMVLLFSVQLQAQGINNDFERIRITDVTKHILVGMDISPDNKYLTISGNQSYPLSIYDWDKRTVIKKFDIGNWHAGSNVRYSATGKYILLQQLFNTDLAPNKDRETKFVVINAETGEQLLKLDTYHAASFTPDEKSIAALSGDELSFWSIKTGKKDRSFKINQASNAIAISPDGKTIAISHHISEEMLAKEARFKKDKKARKNIAKYKQQVILYDLQTLEQKLVVDEFYDIIYRLDYSSDGSILFCLSIPHTKVRNNEKRQTYVNIINGITGEPERRGFTSFSTYEPDFKLSPDGKFFGMISQQETFLELHIYDAATRTMKYRFTQSYRLFEKSEGKLIIAGSRASFVFLPGGEKIIMTMGNSLIIWNFKSKKEE